LRAGILAAGFVVAASLADAGHGGSQPQLSLRATPRVGLSPTGVILTGQLQGGEDVEEFHCPALEWDWDDGSRSSSEEDCGPFPTRPTDQIADGRGPGATPPVTDRRVV
jgi:hypothetical protein